MAKSKQELENEVKYLRFQLGNLYNHTYVTPATTEEWKTIDTNFAISSFGRLKSTVTYQIIYPEVDNTTNDIYYLISDEFGNKKRMDVARLVATYFVKNPKKHANIKFRDDKPFNHFYTNLVWVDENGEE